MAWFDEVKVDDLEDTPDHVKKLIKDAADEGKASAAKYTALEATVEDLKKKIPNPAAPPADTDPAIVAQNMALENRAETIIMQLRNEKSDWSLFEEEINLNLAASSLKLRSDRSYVLNIYSMVKGRHTDEIVEHNRKREGKYFLETGSGGPPPIIPAKTGKESLSQLELDYCTKNKLNPDTFAKSKEHLKPQVMTATA